MIDIYIFFLLPFLSLRVTVKLFSLNKSDSLFFFFFFFYFLEQLLQKGFLNSINTLWCSTVEQYGPIALEGDGRS